MTTKKYTDEYFYEKDCLLDEAAHLVIQFNKASASFLQRRLEIGYSRAYQLIEQLYKEGVVSCQNGTTPRVVLIGSIEEYQIRKANGTLHKVIQSKKTEVKAKKEHFSLPDSGKYAKQFPKNSLTINLGAEEAGKQVTKTIPELNNLMICGNPLNQKMSFVDSLLLTLISNNTPDAMGLVIIDPVHYLDLFNNIPNLLTSVISVYDKSKSALLWANVELENRGRLFSGKKVRTINKYNEIVKSNQLNRIIFILNRIEDIIIDKEIKRCLDKLITYGPGAGIHLIIISDRLLFSEIPINIRANIPNSIIFKTNSKMDELLFRSPENPNGQKLKTTFASEADINELSNWYLKK